MTYDVDKMLKDIQYASTEEQVRVAKAILDRFQASFNPDSYAQWYDYFQANHFYGDEHA